MSTLLPILETPYFGIFMTFLFYLIGDKLYKRWPIPIFNPLIFAIIAIIIVLLLGDIPYETFNKGGQHINLLITPATVALAIKLEKNFIYLKRYYKSILTGIVLGVLFHSVMVIGFALLFRFDGQLAATLFPKSITTAIAVGISESMGGIVSLTVATVVFTGILGALVAPSVFKWFKIDDPVAQGVALGASSHAMGTTKAIEMGEVQGAMSSLSIVVTGIVVVIAAPIGQMVINALFN
ncbi:LrgB family protein [Fundicoccus culcitae]|uniref:LrgB family protein n=1 Tax=Fundicoccus culcitae TaxID=2969821 RepID=A0ABY5P3U0_9LACT|nr:LrgB family protein [Fundicoccus culcitae]UUX33123.1 LrgB family protein [Fundicoccus culcitae]